MADTGVQGECLLTAEAAQRHTPGADVRSWGLANFVAKTVRAHR